MGGNVVGMGEIKWVENVVGMGGEIKCIGCFVQKCM